MASFGDVLRGYGSVLNPQVAQEVNQEDQARNNLQRQLGMLMLTKQIEQESPEYQAKVEALKNERAFRESVAGAGGDMTKIASAAVQYGKPELAVNLMNQQEARAARATEAQRAHDLKVATLEQNHQLALQRITDTQARQAETERHNKAMEAAGAERTALTAEVARGNQQLRAMQFQLNSDKDLVSRTRQVQTALEKANLPQADAVLSDVEKATEDKKVLSYISGPDAWRPDWTIPDNAKFARQAFQKLFNITLKDRSGAAVTNQELERLKQEFATGVFKSPAQLENAVKKARGIIDRHYASVAAGFGKDALSSYNDNLRSLGGKIVLDPDGKKEDPLGIR